MASTLSAKEVASKLETTPKTLRKFLRSEVRGNGGTIGVDSPGKGGRWEIPSGTVTSLKKRFKVWEKEETAKRIERLKAKEAEMTDEVDSDEDVDETPEEETE